VETWSGGFGYQTRQCYAEAFVLNKPIVSDTIHLSGYWRKRANEPEKDILNRDYGMTAPSWNSGRGIKQGAYAA
jgi:hypothetical protein